MSSRFVVGTTDAQPATGSAEGFGWFARPLRFLFQLGVFGARGSFPAGTSHAVAEGSTAALCGTVPDHVWRGDFEPTLLARIGAVCPECATLAGLDAELDWPEET